MFTASSNTILQMHKVVSNKRVWLEIHKQYFLEDKTIPQMITYIFTIQHHT